MSVVKPPTTTTGTPEHVHAPGVKLPSLDAFKGTWFEKAAHWHHWTAFAIVVFALLLGFALLKSWVEDRARRGNETTTAGLNYVVGPMGSGKSMFGVRTIVAAVVVGRYAITNVRLLPGWAEKVVRQQWPKDARDPVKLAAAVRRLEARYVYETSLRVAMRYRVPCVRCGGDVRTCGHVGPDQEGRAVFVWDETHNDLNNRDYDGGYAADRNERAEEKQRRRLIVRWATQLRKLGFSGYLLSQHHENTDAQLRRVCNHLIRLQNQRNVEGMWFVRMLPRRFTLFLVYWYPAHLATGQSEHMIQPIRRERYWLPWTRHLYDSWESFHGIDALDGEDAPILLPGHGLSPAFLKARADYLSGDIDTIDFQLLTQAEESDETDSLLELANETERLGSPDSARGPGFAGVGAAATVRPHTHTQSVTSRAHTKVKAPAVAGRGLLSDHRIPPGDADSDTA